MNPQRNSPRVLFAFTDEEHRLFFPGAAAERIAGAVRIDVTGLAPAAWDAVLRETAPEVLVTGWSTPALEFRHIAAGGGPVAYVCHVAGTVRHLVTRDMLAAGLKLSNWGALIAPQVAEHALLLVLACLRNLPAWPAFISAPHGLEQRRRLETRTLYGRRVALHGFGAIARELTRLLRAFDARVAVWSEGVPEAFIREHGAEPVRSLAELAGAADVFVTCEALTAATRHSIDETVLARLPEGAVFVNVGRGAVVDEDALVRAVRTRGLRFAGDVFEREPLPVNSPIRELPGALLSPHIAGPTLDVYPACGELALANIEAHLAGLPIQGLVSVEGFDRMT